MNLSSTLELLLLSEESFHILQEHLQRVHSSPTTLLPSRTSTRHSSHHRYSRHRASSRWDRTRVCCCNIWFLSKGCPQQHTLLVRPNQRATAPNKRTNLQGEFDEDLLELLIDKVDAQLLETVVLENFKSWDKLVCIHRISRTVNIKNADLNSGVLGSTQSNVNLTRRVCLA